MGKMKVLLEQGAFPESQDKLLKELDNLRIDHTLWDSKSYPPYEGQDKDVFFYGSIGTALNLKNAGYAHQIYLGKEFEYSYFHSHINKMFNEDVLYCTKNFAMKKSKMGPTRLSADDIFCRSNSGNKLLVGAVRTYAQVIQDLEHSPLFEESLLALAEKRELNDEYRCIVKCKYDNQTDLWGYDVVCSSLYMGAGAPIESDKQLDEVLIKQLLNIFETSTYHPFPLFVCDVHVDKTNKVSIVEINSPNCSGLYGCDINQFLQEVNKLNED
jgi:hypothetical protein